MRITLISLYPDLKAFGLRTLSACLKKEGHDVQLIFLQKRFNEKYKDRDLNLLVEISKESDLIGISLMTNFFDSAVQITQALKNNCNIPVLWGGVHSTIRPEECLNYADMVCVGEGESSLVELAKRIKEGENYYDIRGIWFKDKLKIIKNQASSLVPELDAIPYQDYDFKTHYILDKGHFYQMDAERLNRDWSGTYTTMATRGCPFGCSYCCNNTFNRMYAGQKLIRKRTIDNIMRELVEVKNRLPFIDCILFDDDAFLLLYSESEIYEFCERYKKEIGLQLRITGIAPSALTRNKLSLLVDAGLITIKMGIQSASERTKRLYGRFHSNDEVEKAARIINEFKYKIKMPHYDIILDNPWETNEDLIETLMFLAKIPPPYQVQYFSLTFYPGTELYEKAKRDGIITNDLQDVYRKDYFNFKKTYLKRLFFLLNEYAFYGVGISPKQMFLLTNRKIIKTKMHLLLYIIFKLGTYPLKLKRLNNLLYEGLEDIKKGDWVAIRKKLFRWF
mgnify:CR=1 FL=1